MVNNELIHIKDFFDSNGLTVSITKTSFLHFRPAGQASTKMNIKIGSECIKEVKELTYLGVIIDNKITFKSHFDKVYHKPSIGLSKMFNIGKKLIQAFIAL